MKEKGPRAIVVVDGQAATLIDTLSSRGVSATATTNAEEALRQCYENPPHLVIVGSELATMTGIHFLAELLKVSWKTSTILIADEEEDVIHDQTEGLGILGAIRTVDDMESLERLLDRFLEIVSSNQ